jgi:hypothetical protein
MCRGLVVETWIDYFDFEFYIFLYFSYKIFILMIFYEIFEDLVLGKIYLFDLNPLYKKNNN